MAWGSVRIIIWWYKGNHPSTFNAFKEFEKKNGRYSSIEKLKTLARSGSVKFNGEKLPVYGNAKSAIIYCNISGKEIERVIINGKKV